MARGLAQSALRFTAVPCALTGDAGFATEQEVGANPQREDHGRQANNEKDLARQVRYELFNTHHLHIMTTQLAWTGSPAIFQKKGGKSHPFSAAKMAYSGDRSH